MTQAYEYDVDELDSDDDSDDGSRVTLSRQQIRAMERDAKQARQANERAAQLERELAFARVGTDFTERQQKALMASIDGDVTADSLRTAAEELGFLQPRPDSVSTEQAATDRIANAATGSPTETGDDDLARLYRADREGGKDALLAELQRAGRTVVPGA